MLTDRCISEMVVALGEERCPEVPQLAAPEDFFEDLTVEAYVTVEGAGLLVAGERSGSAQAKNNAR